MDTFSRDGLLFDVQDTGPSDGHPVVLLHGFPQTAHAWKEVTPRLTAAGRRCLAPDLRGYSPRARPEQREAYRLDILTGDVLALLDEARIERAHVVGHDWGGALAWDVAIRHPERVSGLTVLSTSHPAAKHWAERHTSQAIRIWYKKGFQLPLLPELVLPPLLRRGGARALGLPAEDADAYTRHLLQPGALAGALNWYRAMRVPLPPGIRPAMGPVTVPTSYLWGRRDPYIGRAGAERTARYVEAPYSFVELDADHWLPEKHPDLVAHAVLEPPS